MGTRVVFFYIKNHPKKKSEQSGYHSNDSGHWLHDRDEIWAHVVSFFANFILKRKGSIVSILFQMIL